MASPKTAGTKRMVRLDIYVKRHPSLSSEQFHERWSKVHGSLVKGWLAEKGVWRYTQYHSPPEMATQALGIHDEAGILEFDGHAEIVVSGIEVLRGLVEDDFFREFAVPDEEALVDMGSVRRSIGYEEVHVEDG
ncbi:Dehydratase aurZ, partial [Lachnellula suecica]